MAASDDDCVTSRQSSSTDDTTVWRIGPLSHHLGSMRRKGSPSWLLQMAEEEEEANPSPLGEPPFAPSFFLIADMRIPNVARLFAASQIAARQRKGCCQFRDYRKKAAPHNPWGDSGNNGGFCTSLARCVGKIPAGLKRQRRRRLEAENSENGTLCMKLIPSREGEKRTRRL